MKGIWGVTLQYDLSVIAEGEQEAIRKAKEIHSQLTETNSYENGVWRIRDYDTSEQTITEEDKC